ncbi:MAG: hypothetical protein KGI08_08455 [Thaumarchaeota archaeon]|nr:hypothetical protein [Nitrososphaerota archaeon]
MANPRRLHLKDFKIVSNKRRKDVDIEMWMEQLGIITHLEKEKSADFRRALSNYVIIRLVSSIEVYFRDFVREIIDDHKIEPRGIFPNDEVVISLFELEGIKANQNITRGRIVSNAINFQNLERIDEVFSKLFNVKSFLQIIRANDKLASYTFPHGASTYPTYLFSWKKLNEIFKLRNEIIHKMINPNLEPSDLRDYFATVLLFITLSDMFVSGKISHKSKK